MEKEEEKEQEVEVKGDGKDEGPDPFTIALNAEDFDPEALAKSLEAEKGEVKEEEQKEEVKEEKKVSDPALSDRIRDLEAKTARLESDKNNLKRALHEERQSKKVAKETEGTVLTDAELSKIIEDHKDDPAVLLNAVTYKMNQLIKKGKVETIDEVEVKQKQGQFDKLLRERYGEALDDESSQIRTYINQAKKYLHMEDHPFGDAVGAAAAVFVNLPVLLKEQYDRGVKDQLEGKAEKVRQENVKSGKVSSKGKGVDLSVDKKTGLTESQLETAKSLGLDKDPKKLQIFKTQILKAGNA